MIEEPLEIEIPTGPDGRLLIKTWAAATGRRLVTIAPQYLDRSGEWRLSHSGLVLPPDVARMLGPALLEMAATIEPPTSEEMPEDD